MKLFLKRVIGCWIKKHYRSRAGSCKWVCYSIKGIPYHIGIPKTKWVYKLEPIRMWFWIRKNNL
jgi:hypothetical protein